MVEFCNRCKIKTVNEDSAEFCWYCHAWLCEECWEKFGHCGHAEADEMNRIAQQLNDRLND